MTKREELERKLKRYQERYQKLQKHDKGPSSRYGDEFREAQMRVLESMIVEIKQEIVKLKKKK